MKSFLLLLSLMLFIGCSKQSAQTSTVFSAIDNATATTIKFSGYTWNVKSGSHLGPGPNFWSRNNV